MSYKSRIIMAFYAGGVCFNRVQMNRDLTLRSRAPSQTHIHRAILKSYDCCCFS